MRLQQVMEIVRTLAPEHLAESWDKVGLQLGDAGARVRRGLLCIDLTEAVVAEAAAAKAQLIVAYHPPIFAPLATLTAGDWKGRTLLACARRGIAVYSPHTALDAAAGGVNDWLAGGLGAGQVSPIKRSAAGSGSGASYKIVTFVPAEQVEAVRNALAAAGAGSIGNYSHCSFGTSGTGTFRGEAGAKPAVGRAGRLERVEELRLEMVCEEASLDAAVAALRRVHPYEEPTFDVYRLVAVPDGAAASMPGLGRRVVLDRPVSLATLVKRVKDHLGVKAVEVGSAKPQAAGNIRVVAVCAGAGGSVVSQVADADAYVTGEMRHHNVLAAVQAGRSVVLAGHTQTERPYLPLYARRLAQATGDAVTWRVSRAADVAVSSLG